MFRDSDGKYWLADGFHRLETAKRCEIDEIHADVRDGSRDDAFLYAAGANADHGLPRTNADKRKAIRTVLHLPMCSTWSGRQIAEHCRVTHPTVTDPAHVTRHQAIQESPRVRAGDAVLVHRR